MLRKEKILNDMFENIGGMTYRCKNDEHWSMIFISNSCEIITGYSQNEFTKKYSTKFGDLIEDKYKKYVWDNIQNAIKKKENFSIKYKIKIKKNQFKWVWDRGTGVFDNQGNLTGIEGFIIDISEIESLRSGLKEAKEQLKRVEVQKINLNQLTRIFDSLSSIVYVADPKTHEIIFVNKTLRNMINQDVVGKKCYRVLQGNDEPCSFCNNSQIENLTEPYRWEYYNKKYDKHYLADGQMIEWSDGRRVRFESAVDITQNKKLEQDRESLLFHFIERNKEMKCLAGVSELLQYSNPFDLVFPKIPQIITDGFQDPENTFASIVVDNEIYKSNIYEETATQILKPISIKNNIVCYINVFLKNTSINEGIFLKEEHELIDAISERIKTYLVNYELSIQRAEALKRYEKMNLKLKQSNKELEQLYEDLQHEKDLVAITFKNIRDGVLRTNIEGKITLINESVKKIFGNITGKSIFKFINEYLVLPNKILLNSTRMLFSNDLDYELFNIKAKKFLINPLNDSHKILSISVNPENSHENLLTGYIFLIRDITEQVQLQDEQLKSQKIDSIAILAAGIAHDFNNFLQTVMGNLFIAKSKCDDSELKKFLEDAEKSVVDARSLTQQLLSFSKEDTPFIKKTKDVSGILRSFVEFAIRGTNSVVEYDIQEDLWLLDIDEGQFSQLINNLVINAVQSMPDGGNLCVAARNRILDDNKIIPSIEGEYVEITIEDTGCGIPKEHIEKVFEPYFTTKVKGNGLGLTMCFSIMKKHDGYIRIESNPPEGTKISLYFPKSNVNLEESDEENNSSLSKTGKILIMDDDEKIQEILCLMLKNLGFEVTCTSNGKELLENYQNSIDNDDKFDLIIIDLINKGGMGGKIVMDELKKIDPEVNAIISSGYVTNPIMENYSDHGFLNRLPKPYQMKYLKSILHEVFNE